MIRARRRPVPDPIRDQVSRLDQRKIGFNSLEFAYVNLPTHGRANREALPELIECQAIMGAFDCLRRIATRDVNTYEQVVFGMLSRLPGVQEINATTALSWLQSSKALPVQAH
jgi:DNA-binding Lrp family transcriptional regulator